MFNWLFRSPKFSRVDDSFALKRKNLWPLLRTAIMHQQRLGHTVWIVVHFPDLFLETQAWLAEWELEYQIVSQLLDPLSAVRQSQSHPTQVHLVLAELLAPNESIVADTIRNVTLAMIVIERHPWIRNDQRLETFARSLPCQVRFGYYLAMDDVVVQRVVNEMTMAVLQQLGMHEHELIASIMITRRLNKVLQREAKRYDVNRPADSAAEWLESDR